MLNRTLPQKQEPERRESTNRASDAVQRPGAQLTARRNLPLRQSSPWPQATPSTRASPWPGIICNLLGGSSSGQRLLVDRLAIGVQRTKVPARSFARASSPGRRVRSGRDHRCLLGPDGGHARPQRDDTHLVRAQRLGSRMVDVAPSLQDTGFPASLLDRAEAGDSAPCAQRIGRASACSGTTQPRTLAMNAANTAS